MAGRPHPDREARPTGDEALAANPFEWRVSGHTVFVSRSGRQIVTVGGAAGARLAAQLETADEARAQQLLARATGNYKRGNERR